MGSELRIRGGKITAYIGGDATGLFKARVLMHSIIMHRNFKMIPTRGMTIKKMFKLAEEFTGQKYKRGEHDRAIADIAVWISLMQSALPVVEG